MHVLTRLDLYLLTRSVSLSMESFRRLTMFGVAK